MDVEFIAFSSFLWIIFFIIMFLCFLEHHQLHKFPQNLILLTILFNIFFRILWFFLVIEKPNAIGTCFLNRLALFFQSCSITILLLMWRRALTMAKLTDKLSKIRFENDFKRKFSSISSYTHLFQDDDESLVYNPIMPLRSSSMSSSASYIVTQAGFSPSFVSTAAPGSLAVPNSTPQHSIDSAHSNYHLNDIINKENNEDNTIDDEEKKTKNISMDHGSERASFLSLFSTTSDSVYNFEQVRDEALVRLKAELKQQKIIAGVFVISLSFWTVIFISLFFSFGEFVDTSLFLISFFFLLQAILTLSLGFTTSVTILKEINQTITSIINSSTTPSKLKTITLYQILTKKFKIIPPGIQLQYDMMKKILYISSFIFLASLLRSICFAILTHAYHEEHHEHHDNDSVESVLSTSRYLTKINMDESDPLNEAYSWLYPWAFYQLPEFVVNILIAYGISPPNSILRILFNIIRCNIGQPETIFLLRSKNFLRKLFCMKVENEVTENWWDIEDNNASSGPSSPSRPVQSSSSNTTNSALSTPSTALTINAVSSSKNTPYILRENETDEKNGSSKVISSHLIKENKEKSMPAVGPTPYIQSFSNQSEWAQEYKEREKYSEFLYNLNTMDDFSISSIN